MTRLTALLLLCALSCAAPYTRPGATPRDLEAAKARCQGEDVHECLLDAGWLRR